jgi:ubiquinone/menaquinone biosynthesis C-methylase UbiE
MLRNKTVYEMAEIVQEYALCSNLYPPEEVILRIMLPHLPRARMLDIGVGGGRTTLHFAKWVSGYVGTDYSESMISRCRRRFAEYPDSVCFTTCDARSMEMFADASFDFVLFSFNGIDYASHEDRLKILGEVHRVGKPGAYFCFSSHNLNWLPNLLDLWRVKRFAPGGIRQMLFRWRVRFLRNGGRGAARTRNLPYLVLNDGAHRGQLLTYYIKPMDQLAQLKDLFSDIRVFSLTGAEISDPTVLEKVEEDDWLYYLCRVAKGDAAKSAQAFLISQ